MRQYIVIGLYILCMGLIAGEGFAQGPNARIEGLADAGVGVIGSGQAIQYNPAGLAFMDGGEAHFTFLDRKYRREYVAGIAGNIDIGTFGLSMVYYDRVYYNWGNSHWIDGPSDYTISGGHGLMINDRVAVGVTLHLFRSGRSETTNLDFDLGTYFLTGLRNTVVAAGVENVKTGIGESGRVRLRTGLLFDLMSLLDTASLSHYLDLAVDVNDSVNDGSGPWANLGIEYQSRYLLLSGYALEIALRGGLPSIYGGGAIDDMTWGVGVKFETEGGRGIRVDYAPVRHRILDNQHHVSLVLVF